MIGKSISEIEKGKPYTISTNKKQEIMLETEKNYSLCRRVYQSLYVDVTDNFIQYIHSLEPDKVKQLDDNIKPNGWGVKSIGNIENSVELLLCFQLFYYFNGRLLLTNGILPVLDGETPTGAEKTSLKKLYELFKDTKSHELVSLQFLSALNLFFGGSIQSSKETITELCQSSILH